MEPELVRGITVRPPEQEKPDLNNEEENKGTLDKNTSNVSSSSTSHPIELAHDEKIEEAFESSRFEPISPYAWSMVSASPPPSELIGHSFSDALSVYDPNRIPESVFSATPSSPTGWSALSNESLFSIHMGNSSFSQDGILYAKSGELRRLEDWGNRGISSELNYNGEMIIGSSGLPTVVEEGSVTPGKVSRVESVDSRVSKVSCGPGVEESGVEPDPNTGPLDRNSVNLLNNARFSEESGNSDRSFAFPVLVGDSIKTVSLGVTDISEEPHLEEQVQGSSDNNKPSDRKKATEKRRFCCCCWPCTRRKTGSLGEVTDVAEEPHLEEQVQGSSDNNKPSERKKATEKRRFCCWPCTRRG